MDTNDTSTRGPRRSPSLAALLSFVWPGLGQLYLRNRRAALIFAVPALLVLLVLAYELRQGPFVFAARFVDPAFSRAAAILVLVLGAWRLGAVVHAFVGGEAGGEPSKNRKMLERAAVVGLATVIVVSHLGAGFLLAVTSNASAHAFATPGPSSIIDLTTPEPTVAPSQTPGSMPTPASTPSIDKRVTILFTGAGQERPVQYDSIMLVSYDPVTNSVQMMSVPRDSINYPLYFGSHEVVTTFRLKDLPRYATTLRSPDSPHMTLVNEVSYLVGIHIDYYAALDITSFEKLIDMVGGIDVVNPAPIDEWDYDWLDGVHYGFHLAAGPQHLDGKTTTAYVRSRRGPGDNDFTRSSRQQEVLLDLLHKMAQPGQILNLPNLISTIGSTVTTNFPADKVADYVAIGTSVPKENFTQVVLSPTDGYSNYYGSAVCLYNAKVAALSVKLFGRDSLWAGKSAPANTCP